MNTPETPQIHRIADTPPSAEIPQLSTFNEPNQELREAIGRNVQATVTPPQASAEQEAPRIVSAAMLMDDGLIVPGVRHYSPDMRAVLHRIYGDGYHLREVEQGFIDTTGTFLTREEAWQRAEQTGQILHRVSTPGTLFSENLY